LEHNVIYVADGDNVYVGAAEGEGEVGFAAEAGTDDGEFDAVGGGYRPNKATVGHEAGGGEGDVTDEVAAGAGHSGSVLFGGLNIGFSIIFMKMTVMPVNKPKTPLAVYLVGISVLIYGSLFVFTQSHWMSKQMIPSTQKELTNVARQLEFYKYENGNYPDSLQQLMKKDHWVFIADPIQLNHFKKNVYFQYAHLGDHYTLFSLGPDGIAHTSDDIYPVIPDTGSIHYGWIKP
jgi:hypothetical protein